MDNLHITGVAIYEAFHSGYQEVVSRRSYLNRINFFPVPDGDTGTNLVSTFSAIADSLRAERSVHSMLSAMADAAMEGARGNSGIIIAQFISGLKRETHGHDRLDARQFSRAALGASRYADAAVSEPAEGTILTVIRDWASALIHLSEKIPEPGRLLHEAFVHAGATLEKTRTGTEANRKAGVEDAGASGFVSFLEGLNGYIAEGKRFRHGAGAAGGAGLMRLDIQKEAPGHGATSIESIGFRYCTEALIEGENMDPETLRDTLKGLGDSLIVSTDGDRARIHIHTDEPAALFLELRRFGTIKKEKVDDMILEYRASREEHPETAIVTDSIADLPADLMDRYRIHMVSQKLLWNGSTFLDRLSISPETFYPYLDGSSEYPTSSLPEERDIANLISFLSTHYRSAVMLPVGARLSGTKALFDRVNEGMGRDDFRATVIDTRMNSAAQGLLVLTAAEAAEAGMSAEQVIQLVEAEREKIKIFVAVSTFRYMIRSGRVSPLKGIIASVLNLKPIVSLDGGGKGIAFGKAFSQKALQKKVVRIVEKLHREKGVRRYAVVHAAASHKAESFAGKIEKAIGIEPHYIMEISPVVGLHAGVGAVAVAVQLERA